MSAYPRAMTESLNPYNTNSYPSPGSYISNPHSPSFFPSPTAPDSGSPFPEEQAHGCPRIMPSVEYSLDISRNIGTPTNLHSAASAHSSACTPSSCESTPFSHAVDHSASNSNAPSPFQPNLDGLGIHILDQAEQAEENDDAFQATIRSHKRRTRPHSFHGKLNSSVDNTRMADEPQVAPASAGHSSAISTPGRMSDMLGYGQSEPQATISLRSVSDSVLHNKDVVKRPPNAVMRSSSARRERAPLHVQQYAFQPYPNPTSMRPKNYPLELQQAGWMINPNQSPMAYAYPSYPVGYSPNGGAVYASPVERGDTADQAGMRSGWISHQHGPYSASSYNGPIAAYSPIPSSYHPGIPGANMYYSSCDPAALQGHGEPTSTPPSYAQPHTFGPLTRVRPPSEQVWNPSVGSGYSRSQVHAPDDAPTPNPPSASATIVKKEPGTPLRSASEADMSDGPGDDSDGSEYQPSPAPRHRPAAKKSQRQVSSTSLQSTSSRAYRPRLRRPISPIESPLVSKRPRGRTVAIDPKQVRSKKTYMCDLGQCAAQPLYFGRREHLKRHMLGVHTDNKPYSCSHPSCGKTFSRSDNRKHHEKKVHNIPSR